MCESMYFVAGNTCNFTQPNINNVAAQRCNQLSSAAAHFSLQKFVFVRRTSEKKERKTWV